ncbi:MAG TPA: hypothetical protein VGZ22_17525 [Isosphaeraceae bacterium]|jgi:hypothetical protein|nr:hypothetical protein [Isosphaeraceae bacterium]
MKCARAIRGMLGLGGLVLWLGIDCAPAQAQVGAPAAPPSPTRYRPGSITARFFGSIFGSNDSNAGRPAVANGPAAAPAVPPARRDWSTGRDVPLSKPWLRTLQP